MSAALVRWLRRRRRRGGRRSIRPDADGIGEPKALHEGETDVFASSLAVPIGRFDCRSHELARLQSGLLRPAPLDIMKINFVRLDAELPAPHQAHGGDAAVDLHSRVEVRLEPGDRSSVPTGIAVAIPEGYAGLVLPRSGHAARHGVGVVNGPGLIDPGYRGEVSVLLINHGSETVVFARGERIGQLAIVPIPDVEWIEVDTLNTTERGTGGFGSTGR